MKRSCEWKGAHSNADTRGPSAVSSRPVSIVITARQQCYHGPAAVSSQAVSTVITADHHYRHRPVNSIYTSACTWSEARKAISSGRVFIKNSRAQTKLLHTRIILVVVKQHLEQISRCETASGTNQNRWTYRICIINTRRN